MHVLLENFRRGAAALPVLALAACNPGPVASDTSTETSDGTEDPSSSSEELGDGDGDPGDGDGDPGDGDGDPCPEGGCLDMGELPPPNPCTNGDECHAIDVLIVIDNSSSMVEEQFNLAANYPQLINRLQGLQDADGKALDLDVHVMITSTDLGHRLCATPLGYSPLRGAPQTKPCTERLREFELDEINVEQVCLQACPNAIAPTDPYIAFHSGGNNIPNGDVAAAFNCLAPQGIIGCDYSSPLEAVYAALDPEAAWNTGASPFLRDGAQLAILVIADGPDCSVLAPEGYAFFNNPMMNTFWEFNPDTQTKTRATPAICWNAGVNCEGLDQNGVYTDCNAIDFGALHPIDRYQDLLQQEISANYPKDVVFLGVLGVPAVTQYAPDPPYYPIAGGVDQLVYRHWVDGAYPMGDILPDAMTDAAHLEWMLGIGPGCTGEDGMGGFAGQALPPVRVREVCESLDLDDRVRCCIDSICDTSFAAVIDCLTPTQ